jgi:arginase
MDARAGHPRDPRVLWPGIDAALPGQPYFCRHLLHVLTMAEIVKDRVLALLEDGITPIVIGGDHSINLGVMAGVALYLKNRHPALAGHLDAFWLDAHGDANTIATSQSRNVHGMPVAAFLGLGPDSPGAQILADIGGIRPKIRHPRKVTQVGLRDVDPLEEALLDDTNVDWYRSGDIPNVAEMGHIAARHITKNRDGKTVFSLDLDGLDPRFAPSVTTDVPGGLRLPQATQAIRIIKKLGGADRVLVYEIHEFNPVRRGPDGQPSLTPRQNTRTIQTILSLMEAMVAP